MDNTINKYYQRTISFQDKVFTVKLHYFYNEGDMLADIFPTEFETVTVTAVKNGVEFITDLNLDSVELITPSDPVEKPWSIAGKIYGQANADNKSDYTIFNDKQRKAVKGDIYSALVKVANEMRVELESDGTESPVLEKQRQAKEEKINRSKHIIDAARKVSKLMTEVEREQYLTVLNNVENEGGEGYLPEVITQEEYDSAVAYLKEAGVEY